MSDWLRVPLSEYEAHMRQSSVAQLEPLASLFAFALSLKQPRSVALLGAAGGNGLEFIDPRVTSRVVAADINPEYLQVLRKRFTGLSGLETLCADLRQTLSFGAPFDLVHAALVFEHAGLEPCLSHAAALVAPSGCLSVVLQMPSATAEAIAPTPYASIRDLARDFQLIDPAALEASARPLGLVVESSRVMPVAAGKALWHALFVHE